MYIAVTRQFYAKDTSAAFTGPGINGSAHSMDKAGNDIETQAKSTARSAARSLIEPLEDVFPVLFGKSSPAVGDFNAGVSILRP